MTEKNETTNNKIKKENNEAKTPKNNKKEERKPRKVQPLATLGDYLRAHPDFHKLYGHIKNRRFKQNENN